MAFRVPQRCTRPAHMNKTMASWRVHHVQYTQSKQVQVNRSTNLWTRCLSIWCKATDKLHKHKDPPVTIKHLRNLLWGSKDSFNAGLVPASFPVAYGGLQYAPSPAGLVLVISNSHIFHSEHTVPNNLRRAVSWIDHWSTPAPSWLDNTSWSTSAGRWRLRFLGSSMRIKMILSWFVFNQKLLSWLRGPNDVSIHTTLHLMFHHWAMWLRPGYQPRWTTIITKDS